VQLLCEALPDAACCSCVQRQGRACKYYQHSKIYALRFWVDQESSGLASCNQSLGCLLKNGDAGMNQYCNFGSRLMYVNHVWSVRGWWFEWVLRVASLMMQHQTLENTILTFRGRPCMLTLALLVILMPTTVTMDSMLICVCLLWGMVGLLALPMLLDAWTGAFVHLVDSRASRKERCSKNIVNFLHVRFELLSSCSTTGFPVFSHDGVL
jgi:hypothetical protein